jgi:hypothetical protein
MIFANTPLRRRLEAVGAIFVWLAAATAFAQQNASPEKPDGQGPFRRLATGVERTIPPSIQKDETHSWMQKMDELSRLAADAQVPELGKRSWAHDMLKDVRLSHDVWCLEFSCKPVRFVTVEVPTSSGRVERKQVWYLIYRVRNLGDKPVRFVPQFVLHSRDTDTYYPDRIIATAMDPIRRREDPNRRLLNTVQIREVEIPPSPDSDDGSVWGVALWRDVDPSTDRFSIYIKGLTNAYQIKTNEEGKWQGYTRKTLQLNFWRPGDEFFEHEGEIRYGWPGDVDYRWVYW